MFSIAEFVDVIVLSALGATLFLGGFAGRCRSSRSPDPRVAVVIGMKFGLLFMFIWLRATLPRLRYDRLMKLGWKVLLPLATLNLVLTAAWWR